MLPKLEELLIAERDRRAQIAYETRVEERLDQIVQHFEAFFSDPIFVTDLPMFPTPRDVRDLPSVLNLAHGGDIQDDISEDDFLAITDEVLVDIDAYKLSAKFTAIEKLSSGGRPRYTVYRDTSGDSEGDDWQDPGAPNDAQSAAPEDPDEVLDKFFAYFRCNEPDRRYGLASCMTWDEGVPFAEMHAHFREAHPGCSWVLPHGEYALATMHQPAMLAEVGGGILDAVGISRDTPQSVLDEYVRSGRLYCACGDPMMPPPEELDWFKLVRTLQRFSPTRN